MSKPFILLKAGAARPVVEIRLRRVDGWRRNTTVNGRPTTGAGPQRLLPHFFNLLKTGATIFAAFGALAQYIFPDRHTGATRVIPFT